MAKTVVLIDTENIEKELDKLSLEKYANGDAVSELVIDLEEVSVALGVH